MRKCRSTCPGIFYLVWFRGPCRYLFLCKKRAFRCSRMLKSRSQLPWYSIKNQQEYSRAWDHDALPLSSRYSEENQQFGWRKIAQHLHPSVLRSGKHRIEGRLKHTLKWWTLYFRSFYPRACSCIRQSQNHIFWRHSDVSVHVKFRFLAQLILRNHFWPRILILVLLGQTTHVGHWAG